MSSCYGIACVVFDFVDSIETKVIKRLFDLLLPIINLALWAIFQICRQVFKSDGQVIF